MATLLLLLARVAIELALCALFVLAVILIHEHFDDWVTRAFTSHFSELLGVPVSALSVRVRPNGVTIETLTVPNPNIDGIKWDFYAFCEVGRMHLRTGTLLNTLSLAGINSVRVGGRRLPLWLGFGVRVVERMEIATLWMYVDEKEPAGGTAPSRSNLGYFTDRLSGRPKPARASTGSPPGCDVACSPAKGVAAPSGAKGSGLRALALPEPLRSASSASSAAGSCAHAGSTTLERETSRGSEGRGAEGRMGESLASSMVSSLGTLIGGGGGGGGGGAAGGGVGSLGTLIGGGGGAAAAAAAGGGVGGGGAAAAGGPEPATPRGEGRGAAATTPVGDGGAAAAAAAAGAAIFAADGAAAAPDSTPLASPLETLRRLGERKKAAVLSAVHSRLVGRVEGEDDSEPLFGAHLSVEQTDVRNIHLQHGEVPFRLDSWSMGPYSGDNSTFARAALVGMIEQAMAHAVSHAKEAAAGKMHDTAAVVQAKLQATGALVSNVIGEIKQFDTGSVQQIVHQRGGALLNNLNSRLQLSGKTHQGGGGAAGAAGQAAGAQQQLHAAVASSNAAAVSSMAAAAAAGISSLRSVAPAASSSPAQAAPVDPVAVLQPLLSARARSPPDSGAGAAAPALGDGGAAVTGAGGTSDAPLLTSSVAGVDRPAVPEAAAAGGSAS